jgi:DNA-binding GntR family transcriptional regulator
MSTTFERIEPISKKSRIVAMLREAILAGGVKAGDQMVEGKLAQQFGVGQGLIREALIELEHRGFVQRTPFSGTTVTTMTLEDAQQIFEIRIELEPLAFSLAAARVNEGDVTSLYGLVEKSRVEAKAQNLEGFFENHLVFRKLVWELSGNRYLQQTLERLVVPLYALYLIRRSYNHEGLLATMVECIAYQDRVLHSFLQKDGERARQDTREFLARMKNVLGTRLVAAIPDPA